MECCGQHEVCEKDSLLAAVSKEIEYYNDEELDRYRGTASSDYTDEAVEEADGTCEQGERHELCNDKRYSED